MHLCQWKPSAITEGASLSNSALHKRTCNASLPMETLGSASLSKCALHNSIRNASLPMETLGLHNSTYNTSLPMETLGLHNSTYNASLPMETLGLHNSSYNTSLPMETLGSGRRCFTEQLCFAQEELQCIFAHGNPRQWLKCFTKQLWAMLRTALSPLTSETA